MNKQFELQAAALEWTLARSAVINLPMNSPDWRPAINRLSEAEDALAKASRKLQELR